MIVDQNILRNKKKNKISSSNSNSNRRKDNELYYNIAQIKVNGYINFLNVSNLGILYPILKIRSCFYFWYATTALNMDIDSKPKYVLYLLPYSEIMKYQINIIVS